MSGRAPGKKWDIAPFGVGGLNFGWRVMEGAHCTDIDQNNSPTPPNPACNDPSLILPILEYPHTPNDRSWAVIGGPRYRGTRLLAPGTYLFSDFYDGVIKQGVQDSLGNWSSSTLLNTEVNISAFGESRDGEVFFSSYGGTLYKLNPVDTGRRWLARLVGSEIFQLRHRGSAERRQRR